ncbi:MAG: hypothetical protein HRF45_07125 [Fimbriimonadia bacterium]
MKIRYILENPVRRGLVEQETEYGFSSAKLLVGRLWDEEDGLTLDAVARLGDG